MRLIIFHSACFTFCLQAMQILGSGSTFTSFSDLSGFTGTRNIFPCNMKHVAAIQVDDEGSKTVIINSTSTAPHTMILDRPFAYIIYDVNVQKPLFMGIFSSPAGIHYVWRGPKSLAFIFDMQKNQLHLKVDNFLSRNSTTEKWCDTYHRRVKFIISHSVCWRFTYCKIKVQLQILICFIFLLLLLILQFVTHISVHWACAAKLPL